MRSDQRGQTAAELLGVLLLVAAIVAGLVAGGVAGRIAGQVDSLVCQLAGGDCHVAAAGAKPGDRDGDGLPDEDERRAGTDPGNDDSDGDGIPDGRELELGTDPASADSDGDGVSDRREATSGGKLDPKSADSDGDGLSDGEELALGTNPASKDSDGFDTVGDGLTDAQEIELGTDPSNFDSDGDGNPDGYEVRQGDDPSKDGRSILSKAFDTFVLDDPVSLLLPSGPVAKALGKGFERFAVAMKGAYKALREATTLKEAAAARRRILAIWRDRGREAGGAPRPAATPPPAVDPVRRQQLQRLRAALERRKHHQELATDPDKGATITRNSTREADDAVALEDAGKVPRLRRADDTKNPSERGADFVDAAGQKYDHKVATSGHGPFDAEKFVSKVERDDIRNGEKIILNRKDLSDDDLRSLVREIDDRGLRDRFIFHPDL
jgi:hypothetical protein